MKNYSDFIEEVKLNPFRKEFRKTFRNVERMYPGVNQFLSIANRWLIKAKRFKHSELRRLLTRLKRKPDVSDMDRADLNKISKFISKYDLYDINKVRHVFSSYSDFTKRPYKNMDGEEEEFQQ